jgi:tetratricopeptide (TPR) repeat protein
MREWVGTRIALLARIGNWLHGRSGESILDLTKQVDAMLAEPMSLTEAAPDSVAMPSLADSQIEGEVVCKILVWVRKGSGYDLELVNSFHPRAALSWRGAPIRLPEGRTLIGFDFRGIIQEKGGKVAGHQHEFSNVLTRGCELCVNAARALTPEERDECMLLLESIETRRCQGGNSIWDCPRPAHVIGYNAAGGSSALCDQHFEEDGKRSSPIWIRGERCPQEAKLLSLGRILIDRSARERVLRAAANRDEGLDREPTAPAPTASSSSGLAKHLETLLRDQLADARAECERWQKDNVTLARINAEHAETIRVLRAELQCAQAACAAWQGDYQRLRDESNKAAVAFQTAWKEESGAQQDLGEKIEGLHTTLATERREVRSLKEQLAEAYKLSDQNDHLIGQLKERIENAAEEKTSLEAVIADLRRTIATADNPYVKAAWQKKYEEQGQEMETLRMQLGQRDEAIQTLRALLTERTESTISDDLLITRLREEADVMVDRYQIAQHELAEEQNARQTMTARLRAAGDVLTYISKTLKSATDAQATELADVIRRAVRAAELTQG